MLQNIEVAFVWTVLALLTRLGPVQASNFMGRLFRHVGPLLPVSRTADANLAAALPEIDARSRRKVVMDMWESLGRTAGEFPHLGNLPKDSSSGPGWEMVNDHILRDQAARGGAAIFVSGHIDNWEMMPPAVAAYGLPFASIYRPASNSGIDQIITSLRKRAIGQDVPMFAKGASGARAALAHLRHGGLIGLLMDQKLNDGVEARLFGLPAMTAPALAVMALRYQCPVIPGHVQRIAPARFKIIVEEPMPLPNGGDRQADILQLTQIINDRLEQWIRERPHSWLWVHRRFPKHVVKSTLRA